METAAMPDSSLESVLQSLGSTGAFKERIEALMKYEKRLDEKLTKYKDYERIEEFEDQARQFLKEAQEKKRLTDEWVAKMQKDIKGKQEQLAKDAEVFKEQANKEKKRLEDAVLDFESRSSQIGPLEARLKRQEEALAVKLAQAEQQIRDGTETQTKYAHLMTKVKTFFRSIEEE